MDCQAYDMRGIHNAMSWTHDFAMDHRKILGLVIKQFRKSAKLNQADVSEATGLDQAAISRIENGKQGITDDQLVSLAKAVGAHPSEIWGAAEAGIESASDRPPLMFSRSRSRDAGPAPIPLIGWVQAGEWTTQEAPEAQYSAAEHVYTTLRVGRRAFALEIKGDSMVNPRGEPSFAPGTRIIVDPDKAASSGSLVIAQIDGEEETTFKRLQIDGVRQYLVPLNPQFPTLPIDRSTRICGVVVAKAEQPLEPQPSVPRF